MIKTKVVKMTGLLLISSIFCVSAWCKPGDPGDPIKISTADELQAIGENKESLAKSYMLMNDIDFEGWNGIWQAIGTMEKSFSGTFEGNNYTISNLTMDLQEQGQEQEGIGLFGAIDGEEAKVSNLKLENINVKGHIYAGGLAGILGYYNGGQIINTYVTGTVSTCEYPSEFAGGLVGWQMRGQIINSHSMCTVDGGRGGHYIGGLVGSNIYGSITSSYATGEVSGHQSVGGLVGGLSKDGKIINSYATGEVSGKTGVGGLAGDNYGDILYSYATGKILGKVDIGGLVGGGYEGETTNSYWDIVTTGQTRSEGGEGRTTDQMQIAGPSRDTYVGWNKGEVAWKFFPSTEEKYPTLLWQNESSKTSSAGYLYL